ncbi:MAG: M20/M25/M40 family metallo-hydrolase [Planctomycetota bacterium]
MHSPGTRSLAALLLVLSTASCGSTAPSRGTRTGRLLADVTWLADDAREGRRAGTPGERAAAEWLAKRMAETGLAPAGEVEYLQPFAVPLPARDGGGSGLWWAESSAQLGGPGPDGPRAAPLFCSKAASFEGQVVYCGYGIADEALGRNDFGQADGSGKIALIVRGVPPYPPAESRGTGALGFGEEKAPDNWGGAGSIFLKVMNAKRRGYGAVLIAQPPSSGEAVPPFDSSREAKAGIPALIVDREVADALAGGSYEARVSELDAQRMVPEPMVLDTRPLALVADVKRANSMASNVLGLLPGRDASRTVVVGAHFDHLGWGGPGSLAPDAGRAIHNGADDNASGTACVLEIARALKEAYSDGKPPVNVLFALWSAEELGLLGAEHWATNPTVPFDGVVANLNLDMVGRAGDGVLQVLGAGTSPVFADWMDAAAERAELDLQVSFSGSGMGGSDHQVFLRRGVPALHLFSGVHSDYHTPADDAERFEADGAARVVALGVAFVQRMLKADGLPFVEPEIDMEDTARRERGWSVWFGTVPEYGSDVTGLLLAGTSPGSPAEKAGFLAGDIILQVGDIKIDTIHDFVYMLQVYKPGDVVVARYLRDGVERGARLTLATRAAE